MKDEDAATLRDRFFTVLGGRALNDTLLGHILEASAECADIAADRIAALKREVERKSAALCKATDALNAAGLWDCAEQAFAAALASQSGETNDG